MNKCTLLSCSEFSGKKSAKLSSTTAMTNSPSSRDRLENGGGRPDVQHAATQSRRIILLLCAASEKASLYTHSYHARVPRVNNEATGCRRPHPRREPSMTDRATLMARITRPVSPSHPPAILWQPTRPTPPNLFFTTPFLKTNRESSAFLPPVFVPLFVIRRLGCTEFLLSVFSLFSFFLISISSSRRSPILVALGGLYILRRKLVGGGSGYLIKSRVKG